MRQTLTLPGSWHHIRHHQRSNSPLTQVYDALYGKFQVTTHAPALDQASQSQSSLFLYFRAVCNQDSRNGSAHTFHNGFAFFAKGLAPVTFLLFRGSAPFNCFRRSSVLQFALGNSLQAASHHVEAASLYRRVIHRQRLG